MQLIDSITRTGFEMKLFLLDVRTVRKRVLYREKSDFIFRSNIKIPMNISFLCDISGVCVPSAIRSVSVHYIIHEARHQN